jgi:hypothetical protein
MTLQHNHRIGFLFEEEPGGYSIVYVPLTLEAITLDNYELDVAAYPTGILSTPVESSSAQTGCYDLQGRLVQNPAQGIYIKDGKKIIITTEEQFNEAGLIMQSELTAVVWVVCAVLVVAGFAAVFALSKMEDKKTSDK